MTTNIEDFFNQVNKTSQKLVDFVLSLQRRPILQKDDQTCQVQGMAVWKDLPTFGWSVRDAWNLGMYGLHASGSIDLTACSCWREQRPEKQRPLDQPECFRCSLDRLSTLEDERPPRPLALLHLESATSVRGARVL